MIKRKPGRPRTKVITLIDTDNRSEISDFSKTLEAWDRMESESNKVDLKDLTEKLQNALAKSYVEYEQLEKNIAIYQNEIHRRDTIIQYLESKIV
jgi:hypothetical protein